MSNPNQHSFHNSPEDGPDSAKQLTNAEYLDLEAELAALETRIAALEVTDPEIVAVLGLAVLGAGFNGVYDFDLGEEIELRLKEEGIRSNRIICLSSLVMRVSRANSIRTELGQAEVVSGVGLATQPLDTAYGINTSVPYDQDNVLDNPMQGLTQSSINNMQTALEDFLKDK